MAKFTLRETKPDDPIYQEGIQIILVPLMSAPRPLGRIVRGRRGGGMPSVFEDDNDLFDESTWIDWVED